MNVDPNTLQQLLDQNDELRRQLAALRQELEDGSTVLETEPDGGTGTPPASEAEGTEEPQNEHQTTEETKATETEEGTLDAMLRRIEQRRSLSPMQRQRADELERATHAERQREANAVEGAASCSEYEAYRKQRAADPKRFGLKAWEKPKP